MFVYVCRSSVKVCLSLYFYLCVCLLWHVCACLSIFIFALLCVLCIFPSVYPHVSLSICAYVCFYLCVYLCVSYFTFLFLFAYPNSILVCVCIFLSYNVTFILCIMSNVCPTDFLNWQLCWSWEVTPKSQIENRKETENIRKETALMT